MRRVLTTLIAAALAAVAGCEGGVFVPEKVVVNEAGKMPVELTIGDGQALRDMLAAHKGKVVFVDYWATWCEPCVAAFPHTVELSRKFKDQGLATIAVSFDELADKEKVAKFLAEQQADFEHLLSKYDGVGTEAAKDFDVEVLPTFLLYDKQGKLRHKWEETTTELDLAIEKLLAE